MKNKDQQFKKIKEEWDIYWSNNKDKSKQKFYDIAASFYRNYLIGPTLKKISKITLIMMNYYYMPDVAGEKLIYL